LRELISGGRLIYRVPQKIGNEIVTVTVEKNGPVVFLVTTTRPTLHQENETRLLSLEVDDSPEQTAAILTKIANVVGMNATQAVVHYDPWRDFQRWLAAGNCKVVVPYAELLAELIPPKAVRLRRDFPQIILAIKAHALLHRSHRQEDTRGQILATEQDYVTVAKLMGGIVAEAAGVGMSRELIQTIEAVEEATKGLSVDEGATADKVAKLLKLDKSAGWRRLKVAINGGHVVNLETRRGQPGRYRLTQQEVEVTTLFPSPEEIFHPGAHTTAQSRNPTEKTEAGQDVSGCVEPCNRMATGPAVADDCSPVANGHATAKSLNDMEKMVPVARLLEISPPEEKICAACDGNLGQGCPTCKPESYGMRPRPAGGYAPADDLELPDFLRRKAEEE
jgi:hypothetical protein